MTNIHLLGYTEFVAMLVVVALQLLLRDLGLRKQARIVDDDIFKLARLGNRIHIAVLVAVVESLQLGVCGMNGFKNVVLS